MAAQNGLTRLGAIGFGRGVNKVERVELTCDQTHTLRQAARWIHITSGDAWVTATGLDLILKAGESRLIEPGKYGAVVTALDRHKVIFETWAA